MAKKYDVIVIGAGTGGYPAAIRAGQLGKKVAVIERDVIGGECLNWGCIPSKAFISAANYYHKITHGAKDMGITVDNANIDMPTLVAWKDGIIKRLVGGVKQLFKANKVDIIQGSATFLNRNEVEVTPGSGKKERIEFDSAIIATGTKFISLPGFEIDEKTILSSKGLLALEEIPEELICIGGGIIGLELGTAFAKLGSKVKVVELLPDLMTGVSPRMVKYVEKNLKALGVEIYKESKALGITNEKKKLSLHIDTKTGKETLSADKILLSIGKRSVTDSLGLDKLGVKQDERGFIIVNDQQRTNVPNIYAVGDITGMPFLAHKATKQGILAAEVIGGLNSQGDWVTVPSAIFTDPEIAFAGVTEEEAKKQGLDIMVSQAAWGASGRAMTAQEDDGFVKIIADANDNQILGYEIVGPHASDLISEATLSLEMGATAHDVGFSIHPHPTFPEMIMEAAEAIEGRAIHIPNARKRKK